jgi:hypothetical protein
MHNVAMNEVVAKQCNMQNEFSDFIKYNVIPTSGNMNRHGGLFLHKRRECLIGVQG